MTEDKEMSNEEIAKRIPSNDCECDIDRNITCERCSVYIQVLEALDQKDASARKETAPGLRALLADKEKKIEELKHINKVAHELFASESDKLGKIVEKLETENKRLVEALETIAKMDCSSLLHACTIAQEALKEK